MQASPARILDYFEGRKQNLIPLFQRPYSWQKQNWQTLWDDLTTQYNTPGAAGGHFLGAIVSMPVQSVPVGVSKFLIIDGQQRLTTISVLLCALRDGLNESQSGLVQESYLINKFAPPEDMPKFLPTQVDRECYCDLVVKKSAANKESTIYHAYEFFRRQIVEDTDADGNQLDAERILNVLQQQLQVVMINLGDTDDPYLIFESLNFKGEPLSQADLVRNYLLMRFRHSTEAGGEQDRVYQTYWRPMEISLASLSENAMADFLRHYAMKSGDNIKVGGIYAATKARLKGLSTPAEVEIEVEAMRKHSVYYASFLSPKNEPDHFVQSKLANIVELEIGTSYPLLLRLFDLRENGALDSEGLADCLHLIESFVVRRSVCNVPTNALNKIFLEITTRIPVDNVANWLHRELSKGSGGRRFPSDGEFSEQIRKGSAYGRPSTRYVLCALELDYGHKERVDLGSTTIEHILPQKLTDEWRAELGAQEPEATAIHERCLNTFGNLTLTAYNAELGNASFSEKKIKLANTHIELTRRILAVEQWNTQAIAARAEEIATQAIRLWCGPITP